MKTATLTLSAPNKQHACRIIEEIINPALRAYECTVHWPDQKEPEIAVTYDPSELRRMFKESDGPRT